MEDEAQRSITFPEAVLLRPKMYTLGGSFEEVVAFLEGYHSGLAKGNPHACSVDQWTPFCEWLTKQLGVSDSVDTFKKLRGLHPTSEAALEDMLRKFRQFMEKHSRT
jgi:hypothetical protein